MPAAKDAPSHTLLSSNVSCLIIIITMTRRALSIRLLWIPSRRAQDLPFKIRRYQLASLMAEETVAMLPRRVLLRPSPKKFSVGAKRQNKMVTRSQKCWRRM